MDPSGLTRRGFVACAAAALAAVPIACSPHGSVSSSSSSSSAVSTKSSSTPIAKSGNLRLMTGGQSGVYYDFGRVLAGHATEHAGLPVSVLVSEGSKENVEALADGEADLCFCQSDVMAYAYEGTNIFEGMPLDSFCAVAALYDEPVQIVTCNPDIRSVIDLEGRRVSIGAPDSGVSFNALDILGVYGMGIDDITPTYEPFGDSAASLESGRIDAAFVVAGAPAKAVIEVFEDAKALLVPIDKAHIDKLLGLSPNYIEAVIAAGTYPGQLNDVSTVAVSATILASNAVSADDVYAFAKDIFESAADETVASTHEAYRKLSVEKGASLAFVPYHPGAARFFAERGITVETA